MSVAAVIFDFDGTLFDTTAAICHAFNGALIADGRAPIPEERIRSWIGRPLREMFPLEDPAADADAIARRIETYRRIFLPVCVELSRPLPGARECLEQLRGRVRMAIATNRKVDGAEAILRGHGWSGYFDALIGIDEVRRTKPHPEPVRVAAKRLGVSPSATAMVGDTPEDLQAALAAGALAVGVASGHHSSEALARAGAQWVLRSLAELPALLFTERGAVE